MGKEEVQDIAFQIISHAGTAFSYFYEAVNLMMNNDKQKCEELIRLGNSKLTKAHKAQTNLIINETRGEVYDSSMIMIHAQDHLMTTIMYQRIAMQMIKFMERGFIND